MRGGGFDLIGRSLQQNGDGRHKKIKRPVEGEGKAATAMHKHTYCLNKEARDFLLGLFLGAADDYFEFRETNSL